MRTKVILRTEHGSHLYGLARPNSDYDFYEIYDFQNLRYRPKKQAQQIIEGEEDQVRISLDRFEHLVLVGVPQAVEVLFAPPEAWVYVDVSWQGIANQIKEQLPNNMPAILSTYKRTALNFYYSKKDPEKKRRHAFRLLLNARELKTDGRMCARLNSTQIDQLNEMTNAFDSEEQFKDMVFEIF